MRFPVIETRHRSVFVSMAFAGVFLQSETVRMRHNFARNYTRFVIDSEGNLWSFAFRGTNHRGIRGLVSRVFWNISTDEYACATERDISIGKFRAIVEPHLGDQNPDCRELAAHLLGSVAHCDPIDRLRHHIHRLNL